MYSNILVAIAPEHGESQQKALDIARHLAGGAGAKITAVTAIEPISAYVPDLAENDLHEQIGERALADLRHLLDGTDIEARIEHKPAGIAILDTATEIGADCIVLASHQPGFAHFLLGSTAARVVRHAHCSVHVVR